MKASIPHANHRPFNTLCFIFGLLFLIILAGLIFQPEQTSQSKWSSYVKQPRNSIDVLFIGNSHVECTISPMDIWLETGTTSWILAASGSSLRQQLAYFEQGLETQSPRLVALELFGTGRPTKQSFPSNYYVYSSMPFGVPRVLGTATTAEPNEFESLVFPLLYAHKNWSRLKPKRIIETLFSKPESSTAGALTITTSPQQIEEESTTAPPNMQDYFASDAEILKRFAQICREKDINLIMFSAPVLEPKMVAPYDVFRFEIQKDYPEVKFINMNKEMNEIGITKEDFRDKGHLYAWGMKKATRWWIEEVLPDYRLADRRSEPYAKWWDENAASWAQATK